MIEIITIDTPTLGDRSYLVHDGRVAFVVDPQRDVDRVLALADTVGVEIRHVFETHIHNDYVTGGHALARMVGAEYHVNAADPVTFEREPVVDGDLVTVSPGMALRVIATPGHTYSHLSYALEADGRTHAVFSGGSMLFGTTGRPDLLGPANARPLARSQHRSVRRLAGLLPDDAQVLPTHGFGSFCSATEASGTSSTIGAERDGNPALMLPEPVFVEVVLAGLDAFPAYYAHMGPANLSAPTSAPDLSRPPEADAAELRRRIAAGEWVVDLRPRADFARGHLAGSVNIGLDDQFSTYIGWLVPWGAPLTLLAETAEQVEQAQRELVRIGVDRPDGVAVGPLAAWVGDEPARTLERATFVELARVQQRRDVVVLDVRRDLEWAATHLVGAVHIPLHELPARMKELPDGEIWVHCAAGYRASIAASLLAAHGRTVVAVDDDVAAARPAGLELTDLKDAA